jgi:hypothetical protein
LPGAGGCATGPGLKPGDGVRIAKRHFVFPVPGEVVFKRLEVARQAAIGQEAKAAALVRQEAGPPAPRRIALSWRGRWTCNHPCWAGDCRSTCTRSSAAFFGYSLAGSRSPLWRHDRPPAARGAGRGGAGAGSGCGRGARAASTITDQLRGTDVQSVG